MKKLTIRRIALLIVLSIVTFSFAACGSSKSSPLDQVEEANGKDESKDESTANIEASSEDGQTEGDNAPNVEVAEVTEEEEIPIEEQVDYATLYEELIEKEFGEYIDMYWFKPIYLDDDNIPEIYFSGPSEAQGSGLIYINKDLEAEWYLMGRIAGAYVERGNFYYHCQGHSGYYYDEFYSLIDRELVMTDGGEYTTEYDEDKMDEDGYMGTWVYGEGTFNGESVTEDEYNAKVDSMLAGKDMIDLQKYHFTKNGQPIDEDEYYEHWGEEGYEGGPDLLWYNELKEILDAEKK